MAMQQCPNGHLYDDAKNSTCPYCSDGNSIGVTVPLDMSMPSGGAMFPPTAQIDTPKDDFPKTTPVEPAFSVTTYKDDVVNENGNVEVRGWLICLEGKKRGADFKVLGEKNSIGRNSENDINIDFDTSVSKGVNATISYDVRNNKFFIYGGESKNNIYVNNNLLMIPVELKDYDIIEIGNTKLMFRSLCNEQFTWEALKKDEEK